MPAMYRTTQFSPDTRIKLGVGLIIKNDRSKILMEKRSDNGMWGLPGGGVEPGETIMETALRETREETGLNININGLLGVYSDPSDGRIVTYPDNGDIVHIIDIILTAEIESGDIVISDESLDLRFYDMTSLPENIVPPAIRPLNDYNSGIKCGIY